MQFVCNFSIVLAADLPRIVRNTQILGDLPIKCSALYFETMRYSRLHAGNAGSHRIPSPGRKMSRKSLLGTYLKRCAGVMQCSKESFKSEAALLEWLGKQRGRTSAVVLLLDARGRQMTSEALAAWLERAPRWRRGAACCIRRIGSGRRLVRGHAGKERNATRRSAAVIGSHDVGALARSAGDGRANLPRMYNSHGPPVPHGTLRIE